MNNNEYSVNSSQFWTVKHYVAKDAAIAALIFTILMGIIPSYRLLFPRVPRNQNEFMMAFDGLYYTMPISFNFSLRHLGFPSDYVFDTVFGGAGERPPIRAIIYDFTVWFFFSWLFFAIIFGSTKLVLWLLHRLFGES